MATQHYHHHDHGMGRLLSKMGTWFLIFWIGWLVIVLLFSYPWLIIIFPVAIALMFLAAAYWAHQKQERERAKVNNRE